MTEYKISTQLLNNILQYLGQKPFVEVAGLIQSVQTEIANQSQSPSISES